MRTHWIDVSIPLSKGMTVWPGDPPFMLHPKSRIARGDTNNTSVITLGTHTGTHLDAPWHFEEDGRKLDAIDSGLFFGDALLLAFPNAERITADMLGPSRLPSRVLFRTRNSEYSLDGAFRTDYTALEADAAQRLVDDGVGLVGVDYLSVAPFRQEGQETHHRLLRNDVVVVEGLRLRNLAPGTYWFIVLPLALAEADGAPCRAFIGSEVAT